MGVTYSKPSRRKPSTRKALAFRRRLAGLALVPLLALPGCSTFQKAAPVAPAAPPPVPVAAPHLPHAIDLLEAGKAQDANVELHAYLKAFPDSREAKFLIAQIETPIASLYPSASFTVRLAKDESLASLAHIYLGSARAFYGLARFNNIAVPGKAVHGQLVRIPKTAEALAALASRAPKAAAPVAPAPVQTVPEKAPDADQQQVAEDWYRRGLIAFQRQDLDTAIADWDKTLAIEPDDKEAQLNRAQAVRLRTNLAKLKQKNATP